jgi:formate hydrogenlyase subunit 4
LLYISAVACIFVPVGLEHGYAVGLLTWLVKLAIAGVLLGIFEMSVAKMRVFRVPNFLGAALMLSLLGVLLLFVSHGM